MRKVKRIIGKIIVMMMLCFAIGTVAFAAENAATEVQIAIEGTEQKVNVLEKPDEPTKEIPAKAIQTGDKSFTVLYILASFVAILIAGVCMWKKKKIGIAAVLALLVSVCFWGPTVKAAPATNNLNVTIPSRMEITFHEDGTQTISPFEIENHSNLPILISTVNANECNDWKLVSETENIEKDQKHISFLMEKHCLQSGENVVNISVNEHSKKEVDIELKRGAWSDTKPAETAINLDFEYAFLNKQFKITFDANGGNPVSSINAYNDEKVTLPITEKDMYAFQGWQDEVGNTYKTDYIMPARDVTLKALWKETEAYAIYSADDKSLTFVRSENPILAGSTYNGKKVTSVYTGFETASYTNNTLPWLRAGGNYGGNIVRVTVEDTIRPVSTAYWFFSFRDCTYLELSKLDMSRVTDMTSMFSGCGCEVTGSVVLTGISGWDTSNVVKMGTAFRHLGEIANELKIDDISQWDTSSVKDMLYMFFRTGMNCEWTLDLSSWDVKNVVEHTGFDEYAETKVIEPKW